MKFSSYFIDRPVFATVLSAFILIAGAIALFKLPVSEYPEVVPPSVVVRANYPGANPRVISETVAAPLEQEIVGVEDMLYMSSYSSGDGAMSLTITFELGTDLDQAQVLVQNRVAIAEPRLPEEVRRQGITTEKSSPDLMMVIHMLSPDDTYDQLYVSNYARSRVRDVLLRLDGVGDLLIFGEREYSLRIWLDPEKLSALGMTSGDIVEALRAQNVQVSGGSIGAPPNDSDTAFQYTVTTQGRFDDARDFRYVIVKSTEDGRLITLQDVARIELGAKDYITNSYLNGKPAVALGIFQRPGTNALGSAEEIQKTIAELAKDFPPGLTYEIVYNPTEFIAESINEVYKTILEAIALVIIVIIVFLQSWRMAIVPIVAIPVSLIGTLAILFALGFSLNMLTLFGLVLAIGIVVDDAIVVVENVERNIENGLSARDATYQAMKEVSGPIVAIALVLVAVFVPLAFISGLSGQFYNQFALTIAISTVISAINSLTLSPALAALLLKGHDAPKDWLTRAMDKVLGPFFRLFNKGFTRSTRAYTGGVKTLLGRKAVVVGVYGALVAVTLGLFQIVPGGFVPAQDKQYLVGFAQLPDGATLDRTEDVIRKMSDIALKEPGVESAVAFPGLSIAGFTNSSNAGIVFVTLKPFAERTTPNLSGGAIAMALNQKFFGIDEAFIAMFPPPPVMGLGTIGGFKLQIEDRAGLGYKALDDATKAFLGKAMTAPELAGLFTSYRVNVPQLYADIDRTAARQLSVAVPDIFETLQAYLGSVYVNDFNKFGRTYSVRVQADAKYRAHAEDIARLQVRSTTGQMVPLGAVLKMKTTAGPERAQRYNGFLAADVSGGPAPGYSSGQAQDAIERIAAETLPAGISYEWTELTYQQILAGNSAVLIYPLAILLVFLVLAALYESLILPVAILMIVPMGLMAAMAGVWLTGGDNNIFTQIGLFVLVGLSAKNAILIVEFARELEFAGRKPFEAALEASRLRLRPILMTSMAFIMGVLPLVTSTGAGAEMRHAMGVAVFAGMIGVTLFGIFLTPVFYLLVRALSGFRPLRNHNAVTEEIPAAAHAP